MARDKVTMTCEAFYVSDGYPTTSHSPLLNLLFRLADSLAEYSLPIIYVGTHQLLSINPISNVLFESFHRM